MVLDPGHGGEDNAGCLPVDSVLECETTTSFISLFCDLSFN